LAKLIELFASLAIFQVNFLLQSSMGFLVAALPLLASFLGYYEAHL
jgi:hypothetical protein